MTIHVQHEAVDEAQDAAEYYESKVDGLGDEFRVAFRLGLAEVSVNPQRYPIIRDLFRRYLIPRFRYSIVYRQVGNIIRVTAVAHPARRPGYWMKRVDDE